jgi:nitrogen fixation protein NifB
MLKEVAMDQQINMPSTEVHSHTNPSHTIHHFFSKSVQSQIARHPCYSRQAHQYARIHLPVAPACNIQCNYCNRKYDCSNESRPGVVSHLIDPATAVKQFRSLKKRAPNLTVVGIAGPGDALANPQATFATLRAIRRESPQTQLCLSTNGLMLLPYVDTLAELGVHHLTVTINCIDPAVGVRIYPWIYYDHQRLRGISAAKTLIQCQLAGLEAATARNMLVKINSVLIPGINDHHIDAVSQAVRQRGALLHNIMPLISDPAHGTYYGITGQRGPTTEEMTDARDISGLYMPQMTHCQQCRADAAGTLGGCNQTDTKDRSHMQHETKPPHSCRVAIAGTTDGYIRSHFGHTRQFEIYDYSPQFKRFHLTETRFVDRQYCHGTADCAEEPATTAVPKTGPEATAPAITPVITTQATEKEAMKEAIIATIADCDIVLCARIGITPWRSLEKHRVVPNIDYAFQPVEKALADIAARLELRQNDSRQDCPLNISEQVLS